MQILSIFIFSHFFMVFLGAFLKAGFNEFEISIKFCSFLIHKFDIFHGKNFGVIIALFADCTFSNILQKVKSYANIFHYPFDS
jgi:hypothetical protein